MRKHFRGRARSREIALRLALGFQEGDADLPQRRPRAAQHPAPQLLLLGVEHEDRLDRYFQNACVARVP